MICAVYKYTFIRSFILFCLICLSVCLFVVFFFWGGGVRGFLKFYFLGAF